MEEYPGHALRVICLFGGVKSLQVSGSRGVFHLPSPNSNWFRFVSHTTRSSGRFYSLSVRASMEDWKGWMLLAESVLLGLLSCGVDCDENDRPGRVQHPGARRP